VRTGELGFWWRALGGASATRPPLEGDGEADVVIVGAGFTGLWTAYYLAHADPSLQIVVLEAESAGFGASGRNGGWVSGFFSGPDRVYERNARAPGDLAALRSQMFATVQEIAAVAEQERIECDLLASGQIAVALGPAQATRLHERVRRARAEGLGEEDLRELDLSELDERLRVRGASAASFTPHVTRVQPARLVAGLAEAVERLGVTIYERTPVRAIDAHAVSTQTGTVRARWIVRATEGYTASLRGDRRLLLPMNSSMIITEPLAPEAWEQIGWVGQELLADEAHVYVYLQRTQDGRIAIGGRGSPYRFGSATDGDGATPPATVAGLRAKLAEMFPAAAGAAIDHAWSGVLGVPRDWSVSVDADPRTGLAWAGGYVGEGVAASNLAGRTLRDLLLHRDSELTRLPWVGRHPRPWEPEPLRWASVHAVYALYRRADRDELRSGRPSRLARLVDAASGRV
jgi:glycine/D-amino acid oxidase-like deaminating enzyme